MDNKKFIHGINVRDIDAYKEIYDRLYRALVVYARNFVDTDEAGEDIVQEIIITIWENKMTFETYPAFSAYLYNAVRNASLNYLKHQGVEDKYMEYLSQTYSPFEEAELNEEEVYARIFELIDRLPARCREVFLLYMEGKKNEEIAVALNLSVETVKTQKKRAKLFLRENLDKSILTSWLVLSGNMWLFDIINLQ